MRSNLASVAGVLAVASLFACSSDTRAGMVPQRELALSARGLDLGASRRLDSLGIEAPLPPAAKVEELLHDGVHRASVTSLSPELILDIEEADALSARYDDVLDLATKPSVPGDRVALRHNTFRDDDGTFAVVVEHAVSTQELGQLVSYTLDMRVRVAGRPLDCAGTASSLEALQRMAATCNALKAD